MTEQLALVVYEPDRELMAMHFACGMRAARHTDFWFAGQITDAAPRLEDDICVGCGRSLEEAPPIDELELVRLPNGEAAWLRAEEATA
jgi:hypothetical protein